MTTSKDYDLLNRLTNIVSSGTGFQLVSFSYQNNHGNQRVRSTLADGSYWLYEYDAQGQVKSGKNIGPTVFPWPASNLATALMKLATGSRPKAVVMKTGQISGLQPTPPIG